MRAPTENREMNMKSLQVKSPLRNRNIIFGDSSDGFGREHCSNCRLNQFNAASEATLWTMSQLLRYLEVSLRNGVIILLIFSHV